MGSRPAHNPEEHMITVMMGHDLTIKKTLTKRKTKTIKKTFKERSKRLVTFETYDQSDEETRPGQPKDNFSNNDKCKYIDHDSDMKW